MHPAEYDHAWECPATRAAWGRHMAMTIAGQAGWIAAFPALLYVMVVFTSPAWVVIFAPIILYSLYRMVNQAGYFPWAFRMRRILRQYPWRVLQDVPRSLSQHPEARDKGAWLEFRNPAAPGQKVPLVFVRRQRAHWWLKRIGHARTKPDLKSQIEPVWFAGDPRFLGVIAAPGRGGKEPRRLHVLFQRPVFDRRRAPESWEADSADIERARRAGALYLDDAVQPFGPGDEGT
ncbi:hypothetical protein CTZ28_35955 [Streptomyces shenzhenensis]|uniref:Uncharacterized protein n=2 Tax=Streptomyces shenzhenensis TaxID=943815 RepID=A0A3M0HUP7_9ACTN|nr:hypothetical protein CTZ28_35955 [Streptomyces shenzhenensis]